MQFLIKGSPEEIARLVRQLQDGRHTETLNSTLTTANGITVPLESLVQEHPSLSSFLTTNNSRVEFGLQNECQPRGASAKSHREHL